MTKKHNNPAEKGEPKPIKPGSYDGELSSGKQWRWRGVGAPDDQWVAIEEEEQAPPKEKATLPAPEQKDAGVTPLAASASFYLTVTMTYPAGATQIGQATTYQLIAPWGQSTACIDLLDAFNQMVSSGSAVSGQMGNFLNNGVTRGLTTTSATVPVSASYFQALP